MPNKNNSPSLSLEQYQIKDEPLIVYEVIDQSSRWILRSGMTVVVEGIYSDHLSVRDLTYSLIT